jgi:hypothetical protein
MHRTICDFALDLVQNSIEASSSLIVLDVIETEEHITFFLSDNGVGMEPEELEAARDPFYTSGTKHATRKVGLGIPFLVQAVEMAGGQFDISSEKGRGTSATFTFRLDNIDTPPLGNLAETFFAALTYPGDFELVIHRKYGQREVPAAGTGTAGRIDAGGSGSGGKAAAGGFSYTLERAKLREAAGNFEEIGSLKLLRRYIRSQEEAAPVESVS